MSTTPNPTPLAHEPVPGTIVDRFGQPWLQSQDRPGLYPLGAQCAACGNTAFVRQAADSAWWHWRQPQSSIEA